MSVVPRRLNANITQRSNEGSKGNMDCVYARPFIKWAGGKRSLLPHIDKLLPDAIHEYYEPFLGGGAVFFALNSMIRKAHLSDLNAELMLTYQMLQTEPDKIITRLRYHKRKHNKEHYLSIRREMDNEKDAIKRVASFIYLNKTCYNGLYRVNSKGQFNVPMGRYENPLICDSENLRSASAVLSKAQLSICCFSKIEPGDGDLVYCDPPYDKTFTSYTDNGFGIDKQRELKRCADRWSKNGATVIVSNSGTDFIRQLWRGWSKIEISALRSINSNAAGRASVRELLITK